MMQNKIIVIGLMGNSGCGKSTVSEILKQEGAYIIDADKISHSIMQKGQECYNEVVQAFGSQILNDNGEIDRKILGGIVFNDKNELKKLNEISHRLIVKNMIDEKNNVLNNSTEYKYIVMDAPLLTETGLDKQCDVIWLVYADYEKRIERIIKRDGITRERVVERFKNQTPFENLKKYADYIIDNTNYSNDELKDIIISLLKKIQIH